MSGNSDFMTKNIPHYNPKLKARARQLRSHMTKGEIILWQQLKNRKMMGYDFDRQKPIDQFIVDFYCKSLALAIEIDGSVHDSDLAQQYDRERQARLEALDIQFLRFSDKDIKQNINGVCLKIATWIKQERMRLAKISEQ